MKDFKRGFMGYINIALALESLGELCAILLIVVPTSTLLGLALYAVMHFLFT